MNSHLYTDALIFDGQRDAFTEGALWVSEGRIKAILEDLSDFSPEVPRTSLKGAHVAPGFLDLQLNGCGGVLLNDAPDLNCVRTMSQTNRRYGVTSFLPTLITCDSSKLEAALEGARAMREAFPSEVLGLHLEGPFINPQKKGAHPEAFIRPLKSADCKLLTQHAQDIGILTLAPELQSQETLEALKAGGVRMSLGHSMANYEEARRFLNAFGSLCTHLFNASAPMNAREPGWPFAVMDSPTTFAGIIADGQHVHPSLLNRAKRALGPRLFFVTDAMPPAGVNMSQFVLEGTNVYKGKGGALTFQGGTLAGSGATMIDLLNFAFKTLQWSPFEALRSASRYPAEAIGALGLGLGRLVPGGVANAAIFRLDDSFRPLGSMVRGELFLNT